LIEQAIQEYDLPVPDYVVGDVGTTIYQVDQMDWELWTDWQQQLSRHWCLPIVDQLKSYMSGMPEFTLQEGERQNQFKVSYYVPLNADAVRLNDCLESQMARLGMRANLIWSVNAMEGVRLLDVLPSNANKLHAIRYIMQCKEVERLDTVFAGDSGNDKEVMCSEIQSVLVANAEPEMKQWALENGDDTLYIAKGGEWGLNGNYRSGILEGACYFWPNIRKWMQELHSQGGI
jgi:hypothetical protein